MSKKFKLISFIVVFWGCLGATAFAAGSNSGNVVITQEDRILVLAPHPDDEVLGAAGIIQQAVANMPSGPFHADVPDYYLPPKEDVYNNMEALIYHFKIVMGEIPVPKGEVYHAVEGGNGELGFYLISDGSRVPYRLHFRRPCFIYYQAYAEMTKGHLLSDAIIILSSMNVIAGELDS